jgi:hypothetical protein
MQKIPFSFCFFLFFFPPLDSKKYVTMTTARQCVASTDARWAVSWRASACEPSLYERSPDGERVTKSVPEDVAQSIGTQVFVGCSF